MQLNEMVVRLAAEPFGVDPLSLRSLGGSDGAVFSCRKGSRAYVLKIIPLPVEQVAGFAARLAYVRYLAENGVSIAAPVPSLEGRDFEQVQGENEQYVVTLAPQASGRNPTGRNAYLWNDKLFNAWGRVMGRMHALARSYPAWNKETGPHTHDWRDEFDSFAAEISEPKVRARWLAQLDLLRDLPIQRDGYGLVHNDLHQWNFLYHPDLPGPNPITVIDFDVCGYHWFVQDIAIPLYHAVTEHFHAGPAERESAARAFLSPFLDGYYQENDLDPGWLQRLPFFAAYREILVYLALSKDWPQDRRARWQSNLLAEKRARITRGEPVIPRL